MAKRGTLLLLFVALISLAFLTKGALAGGFETRSSIVNIALAQVGKPYSMDLDKRLGPNYFDCSGLVWYSYTNSGVYLNNTLVDWVAYPIDRADLLPGDLVYMGYYTRPGYPFPTGHHVGLYIGRGEVVHASGSVGSVIRESLDARSWTWYGRVPAYNWPDGDNSSLYAVNYTRIFVPTMMYVGDTYHATLKAVNKGTMTWLREGNSAVYLTYYWINKATGETIFTAGVPRVMLSGNVAYQQGTRFEPSVVAPSAPGSYILRFDLFQEGVGLFYNLFCSTLDTQVEVRGSIIYNWNKIQTISSSEMATYPDGSSLKTHPGTLIKGSGSDNVYVVDFSSGTYSKRWITSSSVFNSLGYYWEDITTVSDSELSTYADGSAVSDTSLHPNGALVKTVSSCSVFLLEEGKKRLISLVASFISHGFRWDRIITVTDAEMASYPSGPDLKVRPGTLIKGSSPAVYVTDVVGGTYYKRPLASAAVFTSLGYRWQDIMTISDSELAEYTNGPSVLTASPHPNGSLVKTSSSDVYLLEEGKRRLVPSYLYIEAYDALLSADDSSVSTMIEGSTQSVPFNLRNAGSLTWESVGPNQISFSYQWINADTGQVSDGLRTSLPSTVLPGGEVAVSPQVQAPNQAGTYLLKWDLIQGTTWFSSKGSPARDILVGVHPPYPGAALIKTASSSAIYLLEGGQKRWITSPVYFSSHGFRWDRIVTISSSEMANYADGSPLNICPGTLVKGGNSSVYVTDLVGGTCYKRPIASVAVFEALGYHWEDVVTVSDPELNTYTNGGAVSDTSLHPNGSLIKTASSLDVFYLEGGQKRLLTYASFVSNGFRWDRIITISDSEIQTYSPGSGLKARPGTLLKGGTSSIYVVDLDGGAPVRRGIASPTVFESLGYNWYGIITVSDSELSSYTLGTTLQ